jgi:hypothetical protein
MPCNRILLRITTRYSQIIATMMIYLLSTSHQGRRLEENASTLSYCNKCRKWDVGSRRFGYVVSYHGILPSVYDRVIDRL